LDVVLALAGGETLDRAGWIETGQLTVPIMAKFSLRDASLAHKRLTQGHVLGKIVLEIAP
jgi:NADPH:quinone reductase-like Zn-dependent oxidoreductase